MINNLDTSIKSFVLRSGRITAAQKKALGNYSTIPFSKNALSFKEVFGNNNPVIIEIGFGDGAASAQIAEVKSENNYLGIEVFESGVGKLIMEIEKRRLENIRIIKNDSVKVLQYMIANNSVDGFHIFFPDPWPKKRHHKRRLLKRPFTDLLTNKLKEGGYIYFVTDWEEYAESALFELENTANLKNKYADFAPRAEWRSETKFESKALKAGRVIKELFFYKGQ